MITKSNKMTTNGGLRRCTRAKFLHAAWMSVLVFLFVVHRKPSPVVLRIVLAPTVPPVPLFAESYARFIPRSNAPRQERPVVTETFTNLLPPPGGENYTEWSTCDPVGPCVLPVAALPIDYPTRTKGGEATVDFIDRVLRKAWGPRPPSIDLYLRAGCGAATELQYFFMTTELFWPRFLGNILVVLDYGDERVVKDLIPTLRNPRHSYRVVYEHAPCMKGRFFNQYSYLTLDRHSTAEYVVTIDSDCAFHAPVTPDLVFNNETLLIVPTSKVFQDCFWGANQLHFTGVNMGRWGHSMITQPVNFRVDTFRPFREWVESKFGESYEERLASWVHKGGAGDSYCWMCQLSTYIGYQNITGYDLHVVEERADPYVRYSIHVTWESPRGYRKAVEDAINQGLCLAFGTGVFPGCKNDTGFVEYHSYAYTSHVLNTASSTEDITKDKRERKERFQEAIRLAMSDA